MRLLSVNVGGAEPIENAGKSGETGIYKRPANGPVEVTKAGVAGDNICDTENHGGADQAVYVFGAPDYGWWSEELGYGLSPGTFGENLTISGLKSAELLIGDRLEVDAVVLEVTAPRIPCATLAARMKDPKFGQAISPGRASGGVLPRSAGRDGAGRRTGNTTKFRGRAGLGRRGVQRIFRPGAR